MVKTAEKTKDVLDIGDALSLRRSEEIALGVLENWQKTTAIKRYTELCSDLCVIEGSLSDFAKKKVALQLEVQDVERSLIVMGTQARDIFIKTDAAFNKLTAMGLTVEKPSESLKRQADEILEKDPKKKITEDPVRPDSPRVESPKAKDSARVESPKAKDSARVESPKHVSSNDETIIEGDSEVESEEESNTLDENGKPFCVVKDIESTSGQKNPKKYFCSLHSTKGYSRMADLNVHMRKCYTHELAFKCTYEGCNKKYARSQGLREHIACKHTKRLINFCKHCGKGFFFGSVKTAHEKTCKGEVLSAPSEGSV